MPKYPWRNYSPLRTHDFDEGVPVRSAPPGVLFVCRNCGRRFKFDAETHRTWAVGAGRNASPLAEAVSRRWVSEACAGGPSEQDARDSKPRKLLVA